MTAKQLQHLADLADLASNVFAHSDPSQARMFKAAAGAANRLAGPLELEEITASLAEIKAEIGT